MKEPKQSPIIRYATALYFSAGSCINEAQRIAATSYTLANMDSQAEAGNSGTADRRPAPAQLHAQHHDPDLSNLFYRIRIFCDLTMIFFVVNLFENLARQVGSVELPASSGGGIVGDASKQAVFPDTTPISYLISL